MTVTLAAHGDLFCIPAGSGYTCLGFDVCIDRTKRLTDWLGLPEPTATRGTLESYAEYQHAHDAARQHCADHDLRCPVDLSPQLIGLEGKRVEVVDAWNPKPRRFNVGKSTGWLPCHLEIHNSRSTGGMAAQREYVSVRVIR